MKRNLAMLALGLILGGITELVRIFTPHAIEEDHSVVWSGPDRSLGNRYMSWRLNCRTLKRDSSTPKNVGGVFYEEDGWNVYAFVPGKQLEDGVVGIHLPPDNVEAMLTRDAREDYILNKDSDGLRIAKAWVEANAFVVNGKTALCP